MYYNYASRSVIIITGIQMVSYSSMDLPGSTDPTDYIDLEFISIHLTTLAFKVSMTSFGLELFTTALPDTIILAPACSNVVNKKIIVIQPSLINQASLILSYMKILLTACT